MQELMGVWWLGMLSDGERKNSQWSENLDTEIISVTGLPRPSDAELISLTSVWESAPDYTELESEFPCEFLA